MPDAAAESSLRQSVFGRTWSIVSPARLARPQGNTHAERSAPRACPFCEGQESETEREVYALRAAGSTPDQPGWTVRVVPNKYPAVARDAQSRVSAASFLNQTAAQGFHEVVIETPDHDRRLSQASVGEIATLLTVYQARMRVLGDRPGVSCVVVMRNEGRTAGASQEHPHSQIITLPLVPDRQRNELTISADYLQASGCCMTCDLIEREIEDGSRVVAENRDFVALMSFAPRFQYEMWILPKRHRHDFREVMLPELESFAEIIRSTLTALEMVHGRFPYNLVISTAPVDADYARLSFHWRLEVIPRLTTPSGLEICLDVFIVAVLPEHAAAELRAHTQQVSPTAP